MTVPVDLFARVRYPGNLRANSLGHLCFWVKQAELEKNRTTTTLWLYRQGKPQRLPFPKGCRAFWWLNDETLLLATAGSPADEKRAAMGLPHTTLCRMTLRANEKPRPEPWLQLDMAVEEVAPLKDGRLLVQGSWHPKIEAALAEANGDRDRAAKRLKEGAACTVLDNLPFWENGGGFLDGGGSRLYLADGDTLTPLTDGSGVIEGLRLEEKGDSAVYIETPVKGVQAAGNCLKRLNIKEDRSENISLGEGFRHDDAVPMKDGALLVAGSDMKAHGINQNPAFYRLSRDGALAVLEQSGRYSGWAAVVTDLSLPAGAHWFARQEKLYWISTLDGSSHLMELDAHSGAVRQITRQAGAVQELAPAGEGFYLLALREQQGPEVLHVDGDGNERLITALNGKVAAACPLIAPQKVTMKGKHSRVDGWVLRPAAADGGKKLPAILAVHGGPKGAYGTVAVHELQYWASRGYGVLYCNPIGGDGKGDDFADIRGDYGGEDCEDLLSFCKAALEQNRWIDENRLGIAGGSYGGFMVNWMIGRYPGRFKAAVSQRSIANWLTMELLSDIGTHFVPDQTGGTVFGGLEKLWHHSPLQYAAKATTPTLFIHSDEDYRCPLPEGLQMYALLKRAGVPTRLCLFHGENHELSRSGKPQSRLRRLQEMTDWFDRYL